MESAFVDKDDEEWHQIKKSEGYDFYHLPGYVELDAEIIDGVPICWIAETNEGKVWIPLIKRKIPGHIAKGKDYYDLTSPYGYPGIHFEKPLLPDVFNAVLEQYIRDAARENYITSFLRMNPLSNPFIWRQDKNIEQKYHGFTISVPLNQKPEHLRKNYISNHRQDIRKLKSQGFRFLLDDMSYYEDFISIYKESMSRVGASDYYRFSESYFDRFFDISDENIHLAVVVNESGEDVAAAGIFTSFNGIIQSHLSATKSSYIDHAPSKLMFDGVIEWAAGLELKWLHLGGGVNSRKDSLYRFKEGFSPVKNQFTTLRIIHDEQRYNNLNYIALQDKEIEEFEDLNYFPLYRQKD
jgi:hypothetical protein